MREDRQTSQSTDHPIVHYLCIYIYRAVHTTTRSSRFLPCLWPQKAPGYTLGDGQYRYNLQLLQYANHIKYSVK